MSIQLKHNDFKIVLLGRECVGKTSLLIRYCENKFNDDHRSTIQASFLKKELAVNDILVTLLIWDTAGQEKFHALGPFYYRNSNGAVIVYDATDKDSLFKAKLWIQELKTILGESVCLTLVGNKCDLLDNRYNPLLTPVVSEAINYCKTLDKVVHYCTSAKLNQGLHEMFLDLTKRILKNQNDSKYKSSFTNKTLRITEDEHDSEESNKKCNC